VQFAQKELDRGRTVFDELVRMYGEHLGAEHTVAELNSRVCFTDDNQVRRALMLLRPSVFDDFSIWLGDVRERFQISGVILTLSPDTLFPTREPQGDGVAVRHGAFDPDHEARRLFFEGFATPYRERGDDVPRGPRPRKRRVPFEVLVRRGLLEEAASPGTFRLTDIGKEVSLTPAKFAEFWRRSDPVPQESGASDSSELPGLRNSSEESSAAGWNAALHQVIDHQDELGLLADALFVILRRARARDQSSSPGSQRAELKEIEIAGDLAARVGLGGVELTPDDLCAQYPRFSLLGLVLASELDDLELNVDVDGVDLDGETALIVTPAAQVSNWIVIASVALFALPLSKDGRVIFRPSRVHVDELWAVRVSELETFDLDGKINALQAYLAQQMPSANIVFPRNRKPLFLEPAFP
jgi:hypothetical protein